MSLQIRKNMVHESQVSRKCPYPMTPEFLVIHNTYNDATAWAEVQYMISNIHEVSFHFAVDDIEAVQGLPLDRNSWSCGDGSKGEGNRKGIQIEICYSKSGGTRFYEAEKNAAKLTAKLLHERGWGIDRVKKHQDFSGKYCPHRTLDNGWASFLNMVKDELNRLIEPTPPATQVWYRVVVGSYKEKTMADAVKSRLTREGVAGVWIQTLMVKNEKYYRVIAGSYGDRKNAETVKKNLETKYNGVWIAIT